MFARLAAFSLRAAGAWSLILAAACAAPAATASGEVDGIAILASLDGTEPCEIARSGTVASDSVVMVSADRIFCRIVAVPSGVTLSVDPDSVLTGTYGGLTTAVVADRRGRFFSALNSQSIVAVWDSTGRFLRILAEKGSGPGEISRTPATVMVDAHDSIFVADGAGRWAVFDPDLRLARTFLLPAPYSTFGLAPQGVIVRSNPENSGSGSAMSVSSSTGEQRRDVGIAREVPAAVPSLLPRRRRMHVDLRGDVWIAPAAGSGQGFVIERRSIEGALLQLIQRDAAWLPLEGYDDFDGQPLFSALHTDDESLLWVLVGVKDPRFTVEAANDPKSNPNDVADLRLEVIDASGATVIASARIDAPVPDSLPPMYPVVNAHRLAWGTTVNSDGFRSVVLYQLHLVRQ